MIIKLQNGNILKLSKEESDYLNWRKLSPKQRQQSRINKAKAYLNSGPNITNFWNAFLSYIGNKDPKNPHLNTGEAPSPGWGKQGITGFHKMMAKLPEAKLVLMAPLAGRSRAAATLKMEDIVKAQLHRDEVYKRWASLYKLLYDPTPTTFRTKPAKIRRQETDISKSNGRTLAGGKGHAGGSYNHKSHTINVTTSKTVSAKNLEDIGFHEGIHSYGLGESPSYLWKTRYLNFPEGTNPYNLDPSEIATHGLLQGLNLGIKIGQSYPGREGLIEIIENRPEGIGFGGIPYTLYNNAKTNADYRRLWSLLNGTFKFGGSLKPANARKWKHQQGGTILPEVTVVPTRLVLNTYYPVIGRNYRYTGHSSLRARSPEYTIDTSDGFTTVPAKHASINKRSSDSGYNFVTNNCADATRCALEAITGKKMNPYFFTTPGDVLDFFKENFDDVRKIKSKDPGKEVYYTNITPKQLEIIKELLLEQIQKNRKERRLLTYKQKGGRLCLIPRS